MVAKSATVGIAILVIGLLIGVYAVYTPVSSMSTVSSTFLSTSLRVDPNDYESQNQVLGQGQTVTYQISIQNQTIFQLAIMNQSQYYTFYGCAPWCRAGNITGPPGAAVGPIVEQNLTSLANVTVTPSASVSNTFTAPSNGTYYFIFDNTVGPSYTTYIGQNASGFTTGQFSLTGNAQQKTNSVNWTILGAGVVLLLVGGAIATVAWDTKPKRKTPPVATTSVPPVPPTSPAPSM